MSTRKQLTLFAFGFRYNQEDCDSTLLAVRWLRSLAVVASTVERGDEELGDTAAIGSDQTVEDQDDSNVLISTLLESELTFSLSKRARELLAHSLRFEKREAKPIWWRRFAWLEATTEELYDDDIAWAKLRLDSSCAPFV